ncbi:MAG: ABC transporter ATP-binding protein [Acetobacteraceae bacterium]|nr:ABC transporter ATP-binding protein [Acetobacteraceae bacterium]
MPRGEFLTLLGPSGCGKTTTLNLIAGLLSPDSGTIHLRGQLTNKVPARRRNLGLVFQSWALFPHMTVFENVAYGLRVRGLGREEIARRVAEMLAIVRLPHAADKYPSQLSGGMQQRVALARALVPRPDLLLLDEPLSNLDAALRKEMQAELRRIHDELGVSTLLVTHSQEEALVMSDRIAVMHGGHIVCLDTPARVYDSPPNRFVCTFLGEANVLEATVLDASGELAQLDCHGLRLQCIRSASRQAGKTLTVAIRPESIAVRPWDEDGLEAIVLGMVFRGASIAYRLQAAGRELQALALPDRPAFAAGSRVRLSVPPERVILLDD